MGIGSCGRVALGLPGIGLEGLPAGSSWHARWRLKVRRAQFFVSTKASCRFHARRVVAARAEEAAHLAAARQVHQDERARPGGVEEAAKRGGRQLGAAGEVKLVQRDAALDRRDNLRWPRAKPPQAANARACGSGHVRGHAQSHPRDAACGSATLAKAAPPRREAQGQAGGRRRTELTEAVTTGAMLPSLTTVMCGCRSRCRLRVSSLDRACSA